MHPDVIAAGTRRQSTRRQTTIGWSSWMLRGLAACAVMVYVLPLSAGRSRSVWDCALARTADASALRLHVSPE